MFLGYKEGYKLWDLKNKKLFSSKHVTLDEASMVTPTVIQQVKIMKIELVLSQRVESDATPYYLVSLILSGISSVVIPNKIQVARMDIEHVEKISLVAARGTKRNLRK